MRVRLQLIGVTLGLIWLAGCGAPSLPLPPSLELPRTVQDLAATRKGDRVYLTWSAPTQTTDGQNIREKKLGPAQVCRAVGQYPMPHCMQLAGEVPASQIPVVKPGEPPKKVQFAETLRAELEQQHPTGFATYAVSMLNWRARSAGLSNQVRVPLAPVEKPPAQVSATVTENGVVLSFPCPAVSLLAGLSEEWRVYRRVEGEAAAASITEVPSGTQGVCKPIDRSFEWGKTYSYHVTPATVVTENGQKVAEVEGDDSTEVKVFTKDVFPPAQPTGVQAVYSGVGQKPFIDLTWAPDTAPDLAGYNVYRHEQGQAPVKINSALVPTPSFRDENVEPGRTYYYSVSAVDVRGNESQRSEETSEAVPR